MFDCTLLRLLCEQLGLLAFCCLLGASLAPFCIEQHFHAVIGLNSLFESKDGFHFLLLKLDVLRSDFAYSYDKVLKFGGCLEMCFCEYEFDERLPSIHCTIFSFHIFSCFSHLERL